MHDKRNIWLLILIMLMIMFMIMLMIMLLIMHDVSCAMFCLLILAYD